MTDETNNTAKIEQEIFLQVQVDEGGFHTILFDGVAIASGLLVYPSEETASALLNDLSKQAIKNIEEGVYNNSDEEDDEG